MSLMTRFEHGAVRKGFILEEVSMCTSDMSFYLWRVVFIALVWWVCQLNVYSLFSVNRYACSRFAFLL